MRLKFSDDFLLLFVSSVVLSAAAFALVSTWQFGSVNAKGSEEPITLVPAGFTNQPQTSPFANLSKQKFYKPVLLSVAKIGLKDVQISEIALDSQNRLGVPEDFDTVGWFKDGLKPGESGNAVIDGHYDKRDGSPAVFFNLGKLSSGDILNIADERGNQLNFEVYEVSLVDVRGPVSAEKAYGDTDTPVVTLITCGGVWNAKEHNYNKRLLIKAKLI